jgi:hypothetical protein
MPEPLRAQHRIDLIRMVRWLLPVQWASHGNGIQNIRSGLPVLEILNQNEIRITLSDTHRLAGCYSAQAPVRGHPQGVASSTQR